MLKIDLHLHTIMSGDSHNTILEYINQAKRLEMKVIGISEHGPSLNMSSNNNIYLKNLRRLPEKIEGIRILRGVEANIIDLKGNLDISDKNVYRLDYVIANIHNGTDYKKKGRAIDTKSVIKAIQSGKIDIISHPFCTHKVDIDIRKVSEEACKNNVLLEVDVAYLKKKEIKEESISNLKIMIEIVGKYKKKVIVNTDSHNIWELADDSALTKELKKKIGLTDGLIINNYPKELEKFLGVKF